ncbi:DUF72 domain-containing protein [Streptomyces sp. NPDC048718]|uniref:DUF72 domain-containing protein n=1 Tax=Streptomyces sp. NPDC048718 TaxID=3365587 RepID=UPI00370F8D52
MTVFTGTCGWEYRDWRDVLYPEGVPQRCRLEEYARHFAAVENDGAFYRLPERDGFARWRERTPGGFVMAVKASRYLTHLKRLKDPGEPVARLMDHARGLGDRLGPVLLQLPPTLRADPALLADALAAFPAGARVAVEFRHPSWWTDQTAAVLADHGAALCWADRGSRPVTPLWRTAGWGYLRLHEGRARPFPSYGRQALASWAERIAGTWGNGAEVFVFFNNDTGGAAVRDARAFLRSAASQGLATALPKGVGKGAARRT